MSAHYIKGNAPTFNYANIMYAITPHYYAFNSFIDLPVAHLTIFRAINKVLTPD